MALSTMETLLRVRTRFAPWLLALAVAALGSGAALAAETPARKSGSPDQKFIDQAARGSLAEIELGRLAQKNASQGQVKSFGDRMAADHSKAFEELKRIAAAKGRALPAEPDKEMRGQIDKLQAVTGPGFDRAYMNLMVADHRRDVADFRKEARSGKDPQVKAFAARTLPTLEDHLKHARLTQAGLVEATRSGDAAASAIR